MSAHLTNLTKQIRSLPFAEMVKVAHNLSVELEKRREENVDAYLIATALIAAVSGPMEVSEMTASEEKVFKQLFSRKRSITVSYDGCWKVNVNNIPGANSQGTELRATLAQALDSAVTIHILTKD
jgi:hypothetical protein